MPGWEELEEQQQIDIREPSQAREDLERLTLRVFGTEDGKKLLQWLRSVYLEQPVAVPGAIHDHAFYREGQNSVIRDIEARIQRAINQGPINGNRRKPTQ